MTKRYVHSTSVDTPLVSYEGSVVSATNRTFLHKNHQGSVIAISNNSGTLDAKNTYDAYGVPADTNQGRFGYTGQMYLKKLKLYHYRARVYNPHIGRFMQTDPIGYEDQINLYAYVGNDPMNMVDPSGMCSNEPDAHANTACQDVSDLDASARATELVRNSEGPGGNAVLTVYDDGGTPAAGWGHNDNNLTLGETITQEQADGFLDADIASAEQVVGNLVGDLEVSQNEFDGLVDLAYNVGPEELNNINSPGLNAAIDAGDYGEMGNQLTYIFSNGVALPGLVTRSVNRTTLFNRND